MFVRRPTRMLSQRPEPVPRVHQRVRFELLVSLTCIHSDHRVLTQVGHKDLAEPPEIRSHLFARQNLLNVGRRALDFHSPTCRQYIRGNVSPLVTARKLTECEQASLPKSDTSVLELHHATNFGIESLPDGVQEGLGRTAVGLFGNAGTVNVPHLTEESLSRMHCALPGCPVAESRLCCCEEARLWRRLRYILQTLRCQGAPESGWFSRDSVGRPRCFLKAYSTGPSTEVKSQRCMGCANELSQKRKR